MICVGPTKVECNVMSQQTENKVCQSCKNDFAIHSEDFNLYEKIKVPPPSWCPWCRLRRRLAFRNERMFYKRKCDLCGENVISAYSPKNRYTVYCPKCWYSDSWDAYSYGRDYDFSRNFFEQFLELDRIVPHIALFQKNNVNSQWVNYETDDKNCYLNVGGHFNQDCSYNQYALKSRDSLDNFWLIQGEFCYENILCENAYKNIGSVFCFECQDIWFSFDCRNCSNAIGCSGLRHKKYHIFNSPVTKEEYERFVAGNLNGSRKKFWEIKKKSEDSWKKFPQRALFMERSLNCMGNVIKDSRNCHEVYNTEKSENSAYLFFNLDMKDSIDVTSVWNGELLYELLAGVTALSKVLCSWQVIDHSSDINYSGVIVNSNNCFGCSNMKKGEYSILNKKYSPEEYKTFVEKIKNHMDDMSYVDKKGRIYKYGDFFPYEISPFSYSETVANEYFPLNEEEIKKEGFRDEDHSAETNYDVEVITPPDLISEVDESILNRAIKCESTGKLFKLIKSELDFYKRFSLPVPNKSPFARHRERLRFISEHMKLLDRVCGKCNASIKSVYKEEEFPTVYCEKCYQQEVY